MWLSCQLLIGHHVLEMIHVTVKRWCSHMVRWLTTYNKTYYFAVATVVSRMCVRRDGYSDGCVALESDGGFLFTCLCSTDFCNSAIATLPNMVVLMVAVLVSLWMSKRWAQPRTTLRLLKDIKMSGTSMIKQGIRERLHVKQVSRSTMIWIVGVNIHIVRMASLV